MKTHSVLVPDDVFMKLMPIAEEKDKEISELVNEALQRYLWEANERKIEQETEAFRSMHDELKQHFLGEYVAIHQGKLVDHDVDRRALSRRVRREYPNGGVLITPVEDEPERVFLMLTPRFERDA